MTIDPGAPVPQHREGTLPRTLPWLLRRVNQRYREGIVDRLAAAGLDDLPQPGIWALVAIERGANEASQLVSHMGVSKQAVSKLVDRLATAGFVERRPNGSDRRRTDLALSPRGRTAVRIITSAIRATEQAMVGELGSESFAQLTHLLERLATEPR